MATKTIVAKKASNRSGTGQAVQEPVSFKLRMNSLVTGLSGMVVDKSDIDKLKPYFKTDMWEEIYKSTLGTINKNDVVSFDPRMDSKYFLDKDKYYGVLQKINSFVPGVTKYELKFYKIQDGYDLIQKIMSKITNVSGLRLTFDEYFSVKRKDDYNIRLTTTVTKLTSDTWDIRRNMHEPYNITKQSYDVDRSSFTGNRHWLTQESMNTIEVMNFLVCKFQDMVKHEMLITTVKDKFLHTVSNEVSSRIMFGIVD